MPRIRRTPGSKMAKIADMEFVKNRRKRMHDSFQFVPEVGDKLAVRASEVRSDDSATS